MGGLFQMGVGSGVGGGVSGGLLRWGDGFRWGLGSDGGGFRVQVGSGGGGSGGGYVGSVVGGYLGSGGGGLFRREVFRWREGGLFRWWWGVFRWGVQRGEASKWANVRGIEEEQRGKR